ncbi:MAG: BsuBI/PstI family type II restriction endonuclease [Anaerolineae bacterium]
MFKDNERQLDPVINSFHLGELVLAGRTEKFRKQHGQFLTPIPVARYMARQIGPLKQGARILDPAIGSGILACALIERAIIDRHPNEIQIDGYELDQQLCETAQEALAWATKCAAEVGIAVQTNLDNHDFILDRTPTTQLDLFAPGPINESLFSQYDCIIANPPYFKLHNSDPRVRTTVGHVKGHTNIYTLFMALAAKLLAPRGQACFIVPRSFCSGAYFSEFRRDFIQQAIPLAVHLFESRQDTFKKDSVLQENVILTFRRRQPEETTQLEAVTISESKDVSTLDKSSLSRRVLKGRFVGVRNGSFFFRLPTSELDEQIIDTIDKWPGSLARYGLKVSTGPVVAFRARSFLTTIEAVDQNQAAPLMWMQNVKPQRIQWPVSKGNKPQGISLEPEARSLLVPSENYVLLRRFSAKEGARRLIAAPLLANRLPHQWVGLENHLNYIYKIRGHLEIEEAYGLSGLFNSALMDRYFRISNGNTQVNAAELQAMPLPSMEAISQIGQQLVAEENNRSTDVDSIVFAVLRKSGYLPADFPTIRETRIRMGKIQEAQEVLKALNLPSAQQNEISALTLLVLAQLSEETPWSEAKRQSLRIHDMLLEIKGRYGREYAENTRETIRRQVIHQFEQASIVVRNPDEPTLPTNSPRTHYALSDAAIRTIRKYKSEGWADAVQSFIESQGALFEIYRKRRDQLKVPLRLESGEEYHLSPGRHNELQAAIVEEFGPRFAPGARLLYLGDAANKTLVLDKAGFEKLDMPIPSHDKLPDVVLYDQQRDWLFLIEAVTSHGPVSPKRHFELEEMLAECSVGRVYVSAFPDFATFKNFLSEIAWETEVWLAEIPDHLIHFNGDRFLGPPSV